MSIHPRFNLTLPLLGVSALALCGTATAGFVDDSRASLELRNFYMNRDFRHSGGDEKQDEWAQGFLLRFESGYTDTSIGVGFAAYAALGVKLDSARGRSGDNGIFPQSTDGTPADEFSHLRGTAKFKLSRSVLRIGSMFPTLPVLFYNYGRLLPSSYSGSLLTMEEVDGLTLHAGRFTHSAQRNSSSSDRISYYRGGVESDHLDLIGGSYQLGENLTASYYYGELDDIYRQHFAGLVHSWPLSENLLLRTDLRYFKSRDDGTARVGRIDNDTFNGMLSLSAGSHKFSGAYQQVSGDGEFPFIGQDPYVVNLSFHGTFTREEMKSWQLRYDYDFTALGIPGLTFTTRYVNGYDALVDGRKQGKEWERNNELFYTVQSGPLKNVQVQLRNITFRSGGGLTRDVDENRIMVGYTLPLW